MQASWDATVGSYSEEGLRGIFAEHGTVEDIILRQAKKKGKGSALVIMGSLQARVQSQARKRQSNLLP